MKPSSGGGAARLDAVVARLEADDLDALIVSDPTSIRWLTGFSGSNALVLLEAGRVRFCTDGRYATQAPAQLREHGLDAEVVVAPDLVAVIAGLVPDGPVGLEADHVTWSMQQRLAATIDGELVATSGIIAGLRARKDDAEIARIRRAAACADAAFAEVVGTIGSGGSERDVAAALEAAMRSAGGSGPAYETIVASGPNAALPHARPTDRVIVDGDLVIVDVGCLFEGYRSDMTRTVVVGTPDDTQQEMLSVVLEAQRAGVAVVGPGVAASAVDAACRSVLEAAGWGDRFIHGTGHGVGLDIHERPAINGRSDDVLEPGMIVTVEPGVYVEGLGGVRWEDLLVVTDTGAEVITASPKPFTVEPVPR